MSTITTTAIDRQRERIQKQIDQHRGVIHFLIAHGTLLASLSEDAMAEKLGDVENLPHISYYTSAGSVHITVYGTDQRAMMRTIRKAIGGTWDKGGWGDTFSLSQYWGASRIYVAISGDRTEVCQRVVTGHKTVDIPEVLYRPARTEQHEVVEWICGNLLED